MNRSNWIKGIFGGSIETSVLLSQKQEASGERIRTEDAAYRREAGAIGT